MKYFIVIFVCLLVASCTYTEDVSVRGKKATFVKKSKGSNVGVLHFPRADGKYVALKAPDNGGGSGFDVDDCNWCLIECIFADDYEACSRVCNKDTGPCEGELPEVSWGAKYKIVESVGIENLKLFKD